MTSGLIRDTQKRRQIQRRRWHKHEGRYGSGVAWIQEDSSHQKLEEAKGRFSSGNSGGPVAHRPPHAFVLDFWPPEPERLSFSHVKPPRLWQFVIAAPRNSYGFREARLLAGHPAQSSSGQKQDLRQTDEKSATVWCMQAEALGKDL